MVYRRHNSQSFPFIQEISFEGGDRGGHICTNVQVSTPPVLSHLAGHDGSADPADPADAAEPPLTQHWLKLTRDTGEPAGGP
eukprot:3563230-Prymnesium_polylepis.1